MVFAETGACSLNVMDKKRKFREFISRNKKSHWVCRHMKTIKAIILSDCFSVSASICHHKFIFPGRISSCFHFDGVILPRLTPLWPSRCKSFWIVNFKVKKRDLGIISKYDMHKFVAK